MGTKRKVEVEQVKGKGVGEGWECERSLRGDVVVAADVGEDDEDDEEDSFPFSRESVFLSLSFPFLSFPCLNVSLR